MVGSTVTTLIEPKLFAEGGEANGGLTTHLYLGDTFGDLRCLNSIDSLVCRRVGCGRSAQPRATIPASIRHGARVGKSS